MKSLLVLIAASATLLAQPPAKQPATQISGTVIDQNGSPVSSATVYAVPQGPVLDDINPRSVKTDSVGRFAFRGTLDYGSYKLYAQNDTEGYLNPQDAFYADSEDPQLKVTLSPKHPSSTVTMKLGKQAGLISGKVFDVDSGMPLMAYVGLMDEEGHGHSMVVDGDYTVSVPSDVNFKLIVTVIGTRRPLVPVSSFRLEPGQRIYLDIPISASEK